MAAFWQARAHELRFLTYDISGIYGAYRPDGFADIALYNKTTANSATCGMCVQLLVEQTGRQAQT